VYRAKGFVQWRNSSIQFRCWTLGFEPFESSAELVFIGKQITEHQSDICRRLKSCEQ